MKSFVKFKRLNAQTKDDDSNCFCAVEHILGINEASAMDKKQRPEINAIVLTSFGIWATTDSPAMLLEKIKQAESSVPQTEA